jgi:hypothetical protein
MTFPRVRRSIAIATLAGGTLLGSAFGVSHALAASKASPTPSQSGTQSGTKTKAPGSQTSPSGTHHCPRDGGTSSANANASIGF